MKIHITICFGLLFIFTTCLHALELNEKVRNWTREDGQTARGRLIGIEDGKISLKIRSKVYEFALSDFSQKDRAYVKGVKADLPHGKIETYLPKFQDDQDKAFYDKHLMQSLVWRGDRGNDTEIMPLMVYQPLREDLEKLPVIIYLHGTGGMGTDNTKPFFKCGGGAAKHLLAESFQKKSPCIVITPQIEKHSGWYSASFTDPSYEQVWLKNAIRMMAQEEKYAIDLNRIYIMGHSMGGHGVYEALAKLPGFYAGGVAIAAVDEGGSFNKDNVDSRLWLFLNQGDKAERVEVAEEFAKKYKRLGGRIKTTIYHSGGHNAWDKALQDQDFRSVLFKQKVKK